jgi:hypothetical protein
MTRADIEGAIASATSLKPVDLAGKKLSGLDLSGLDLSSAILRGARLNTGATAWPPGRGLLLCSPLYALGLSRNSRLRKPKRTAKLRGSNAQLRMV